MADRQKHRMIMGFRGLTLPVPRLLSNQGTKKGMAGARRKAARLTADERRIHHYIVRAMPTATRPIEALQVSEGLLLPLDLVREAIEKLEEMKTFLFRSGGQGIDWAYPGSLDDTGHVMRCSSGERFNAA